MFDVRIFDSLIDRYFFKQKIYYWQLSILISLSHQHGCSFQRCRKSNQVITISNRRGRKIANVLTGTSKGNTNTWPFPVDTQATLCGVRGLESKFIFVFLFQSLGGILLDLCQHILDVVSDVKNMLILIHGLLTFRYLLPFLRTSFILFLVFSSFFLLFFSFCSACSSSFFSVWIFSLSDCCCCCNLFIDTLLSECAYRSQAFCSFPQSPTQSPSFSPYSWYQFLSKSSWRAATNSDQACSISFVQAYGSSSLVSFLFSFFVSPLPRPLPRPRPRTGRRCNCSLRSTNGFSYSGNKHFD